MDCDDRNNLPMIEAWIERGLAKPGKSGIGLARHLKIDPSQISRLKKGRRQLKADEVRLVAEYLEESIPSELLDTRPLIASYDPDLPEQSEVAEEMPPEAGEGIDVRKSWPAEAIPELQAHGGLGTGHVIQSLHVGEMKTVDEVKNDYWRIPSDFARGALGTSPIHLLVVECEGDSMAPTLVSGERVWVNTLHIKPSPDGLYAIRDVFDQVIVKRIEVAQETPLRLRIISDNPKHNPREVGPDEVRIIGKVVAGLKLF